MIATGACFFVYMCVPVFVFYVRALFELCGCKGTAYF